MALLCIICCNNKMFDYWKHTCKQRCIKLRAVLSSQVHLVSTFTPPVANRCLMFLALATQQVIRVEITPGDRKSMMPWRVMRKWETKVSSEAPVHLNTGRDNAPFTHALSFILWLKTQQYYYLDWSCVNSIFWLNFSSSSQGVGLPAHSNSKLEQNTGLLSPLFMCPIVLSKSFLLERPGHTTGWLLLQTRTSKRFWIWGLGN